MLVESYIGGVAIAWLHSLTYNTRKKWKIEREVGHIFSSVVENGLREDEKSKFEISYFVLMDYGLDLFVNCNGSDLNGFRNYVTELEYKYEARIIACNISNGIRVKVWLNGFKINFRDELEFKINSAFDMVRNSRGDTFEVKEIKNIKSPSNEIIGQDITITIPDGLNSYLLKKYIGNIEGLGKSIVKFNGNSVKIELINNNKISIDYEPISVKPYQLYVGMEANCTPIILDYKENANGFIVGKQSTGKTRVMIQGILNAIKYNDDIELYIAASDKRDLEVFKNTKHCTECSNSLEDILKMLQRLNKEVKKRNKLMPVQDMIFDIYAYNEKHKNKMTIVHFLCDEISDLMVNDDNDSNYRIKKAITDILIEIGRKGRSVGVYMTLGTQRAGSSCIHPDLKALLGNKIIFQQQNEQSIKLAVGHDDIAKIRTVTTLNMENREFMYETDGYGVGKACNISDDIIKKYIAPMVIKEKMVSKSNIVDIKKKKVNSGRHINRKAQ